MYKSVLICLLIYSCFLSAAVASGTVFNDRNEPLVNAFVLQKGSRNGSTTDEAGRFILQLDDKHEARLITRYLGYQTEEIQIKAGQLKDLKIRLQPDYCRLNEITVTATRSEKHLDDLARKVEVLPRREIEKSGSIDVAEVLNSCFSSVQIEKNGYNRGTVKLQGLPAEYTLVLVDGEKAKGGTGTQAVDIGQIPLDIVERVEVVKGPTSSLYGSDGLGGVINIITRQADRKPELSASYGIGSEYTNTANLRGSYKHDQTGILGSWSRFYTEGTAFPDRLLTDNFFAKVNYADYWIQSGNYYRSERNLEEMKEEKYSTKSAMNYKLNSNSTLSATVSYSTYKRQLGSARNRRTAEEQSWKYSLQGSQKLFGTDELTGGMDFYTNDYQSNIIEGDDHSAGGFLQYDSRWAEDLTVTAGIRLDKHPQWGTETNPSIAVMYKFNENYRLRTGAGTGFKAPSLSELNSFWFHPNGGGFWIKGNPDLKPEKSFGANINLEFTPFCRFSNNIGLFFNRVENMIITDQTASFHTDGKQLYSYSNCDKINTAGLEYEAQFAIVDELNLTLSYTWLKTENEQNGKELTASPEHKFHGGLDYCHKFIGCEWSIGSKVRYTAVQYLNTENSSRAKDFWLQDGKISCKTPYGFTVSCNAENLFDHHYRVYDKMPGRFITGQISYNY